MLSTRAGMSLAECLVALTLGMIVCACIGTVIAAQSRLLRTMIAQSADAEAVRVVHGVMAGDLRTLARADIREVAGDSIAVRLFRGLGVPCGRVGTDLFVRFDGMRAPAAWKDSLVLLMPAGEQAVIVTDADAGTCTATNTGDGEQIVRLRAVQHIPAVALVFESGTYYLSDRALRYRLGAEGRQPLTDERFASGARTVALDAAHTALTLTVLWPHRRFADTVLVPFANAQ